MIDWSFLEQFVNFEQRSAGRRDFHLDSMEALLDDFGNPHRSLRLVHIAGSKGKGSTTAHLAGLLADHSNQPVGIYGSPHIYDYRERIRSALPGMRAISQGFFPEQVYARQLQRLKEYVLSRGWFHGSDRDLPPKPGAAQAAWTPGSPNFRPTTFELLTLLAFNCFVDQGLDWAVIEVGLGGRLDSTNVITPLLSIITPIELEHTQYLGDSIEQIAGEKAGIIKPGVPVLTGNVVPQALAVIRRKAQSLNSAVYQADDFRKDFDSIASDGTPVADMPRAKFQTENMLCAYAAFGILESHIERTDGNRKPAQPWNGGGERTSMWDSLQRSLLPGRLEYREVFWHGRRRQLLLDGAHTMASITQVLEAAASCGAAFGPQRLIVVFSALEDKHIMGMLEMIMKCCSTLILTGTGNFKRSNIDLLERSARSIADANKPTTSEPTVLNAQSQPSPSLPAVYRQDIPRAALDMALDMASDSGICVCGSFYLLGEIYPTVVGQHEQRFAGGRY